MPTEPNDIDHQTEPLLQSLKADLPAEIMKDKEQYSGFDEFVVADLKTSLELFLESVVWSEDADFRRLLTGVELYLNDRLAWFYGAEIQPEDEFAPIGGGAERRASKSPARDRARTGRCCHLPSRRQLGAKPSNS